MQIKWDTLKLKAMRRVNGSGWENNWHVVAAVMAASVVENKESFNWRKNTKELNDRVMDIIDHWDVRMAKKLVDLFPEIVPARCRGVVPTCYIADTKDSPWMVDFGGKA